MVELDDAVASTDDPIDTSVAARASVHLGQHRGRYADQCVAPRRLRQDRLHAPGRYTALAW